MNPSGDAQHGESRVLILSHGLDPGYDVVTRTVHRGTKTKLQVDAVITSSSFFAVTTLLT